MGPILELLKDGGFGEGVQELRVPGPGTGVGSGPQGSKEPEKLSGANRADSWA